MLDTEVSENLGLDMQRVKQVKDAYAALPVPNKPEQAISRVPVHIYRVGEETFIEEVWQEEGSQQPRQQGAAARGSTADSLAQIPASGGSTATQQVLQTLLIQNQQVLRHLQELEQRQEVRDQANRSWLEEKLRKINNNIRRFGGTIEGGFVRQQPGRQDEVRRATAEEHRHPMQRQRNDAIGRRQQLPSLCPNLNSLRSLWTEYEFGIGGRKPAKDWTTFERGNKKQKQTYYRRNCIWKLQIHLINKGHRIEAANRIISTTYGESTSITNISKAIVQHRTQYKQDHGLHPNFR
jgi:hypothetical protein